jgi:type I restriction enzyme S subunit
LRHGYQFRESDFTETGIQVIKIGNVTADGLDLDADISFVSLKRKKEFENITIAEGDILMSLTGNIGRVVKVKNLRNKILFQNYRVGAFYPLRDNIFKPFIKWILSSDEILRQLNAYANQSAQANFGKQDLDKLKFKIPSKLEQRKIARILSTADAVIEKTQAAIAKYKAIKQGMLHDLFTRGIDPATGKLRPTYEDAPELYKDSKLGWILKEWVVEIIENISKRIWIGLVTTMTTHYVENGVPLIRNNNIRDNSIEKEEMIKLDIEFSESNSQRYLHKEDIVTVHTGDIGTSAIIYEDLDPSHGFATINTTVDSSKINNKYLCYFFNWNEFKTRIEIYATGDGRSNLNLYDFLYIPIAFPKCLIEQELIIERLNSMNQKIQTEQNYLHKIQQIKAGLMADLLSGKKKVNVDEEPVN